MDEEFPARIWDRCLLTILNNFARNLFLAVFPAYNAKNILESRHAKHTSPNRLHDFLPFLRTSEIEASSRLADSGPEWALAPRY